jgi:hypothetical protein
MATLNQVVCQSILKNTGYGSCVFDFSKAAGAIRVPKGKVFTQAELDALRTTLEAMRLAPSKSNRIFPLHGFQAVTDNSEETVFQTLGYGKQVPIRDGNYRWTFQYVDGGMCLHIALRSMNFQGSSEWLFYDDKWQIIGTKKTASDGNPGLAGVPLTFHVPKWKLNDGANVTAYTVYFDIDSKYLNDSLGFVIADFNPEEITGLQNIALKQTGASAAGVFKIQALTGCDYANLYDLYSTQLAAAGLWVVTNATTGNAITITSVAADANAKAFTITLSAADPDYPGTSAGLVNVSLADPTVLDAADVSGFESNTIQVLRG